MTSARWLLGVVAGVLVIALAGYLGQPGAVRDGQIVFIQWDARQHVKDEALGALTIRECDDREDGLVVTGRVDTAAEVVTVAVQGGKSNGPGAAVGSGYLSNAEVAPGLAVGDFQVVLPWATVDSRFALVDPESLGGDEVRSGEVRSCP